MRISLIAALDLGRVIGKDNKLPWKMPADLRHFRTLTVGKPVIMGRKTFESIGKPLTNRPNIVLSRDPAFASPGCQHAQSLDRALLLCAPYGEEVMVIGGAGLFTEALAQASRLYLTVIEARFDGDTRFPSLSGREWTLQSREDHPADPKNPLPYHFLVLDRIPRHGLGSDPPPETALEPTDLVAMSPPSP